MSNTTIEELHKEGDAHFTSKEFDKAFEAYKKIIEQQPDYIPVYSSLNMLVKAKKEDAARAKPLFLKGATANPNTADLWFYVAFWCYELKEYGETIEYYNKVISIEPNYHSARNNLGLAYAALKKFDKAFEVYTKLIDDNPDYLLAYNSLWGLMAAKNDYAGKAKPFFIKGTNVNPTSANLWFNLAYCCYELKEYDEAIKSYEMSLSLDPNNNDTANNLGLSYAKLKEYDKAFEIYKRTIEKKPDYVSIYSRLLSLVQDKKEYALKAKPLFLTGAASNPNSDDFWFYYAIYNYDQQEYSEAITNYKKALAINPDYNDALINLRALYEKCGKLTEAITYFKEFITQTPQQAAYTELLYVSYYDKKINDFIDFAKDLAKKEVDFAGTIYQDIVSYSDLIGKNADSITFFTQLIETKKTDELLYRSLGYSYSNERNFIDAVEQHMKAVELNPSSANYYELGNVFLDRLNYKEAIRNYDKALAIDKNHIYSKHNKNYIAEKQGEYKKAYSEWQELAGEYEQILNAEATDKSINPADGYVYLGNIYLHNTDIKHLEKSREAFEKSIKLNKNNIIAYIGLIKYYLEKKSQITDQSKNSESTTEELHAEYNQAHMSMNDYFYKAVQTTENNLKRYEKSKFDLSSLGELYLLAEQYDKAKEKYQECVKVYPKFLSPYIGLGVANMRTENYKDAIANFTMALHFDPDDFNIQSNLAEAHLKSGKLPEAEKNYKKILSLCPNYIDALMGLAEYYKIMGDKAMEEKNVSDAEEWYQQALSKYNRLVDLNRSKEPASRRINRTDLNNIYYSRGYVKVKLFEIGSKILKRGISLKNSIKIFSLQSPREDFKQILPGEDNYFKAQNAIRKINSEIGITRNVTKKAAPSIIIFAALLILLFTQYAFFIGRKESKPETYSFDLSKLASLASTDTIIAKIAPGLVAFAKTEFTNKNVATKLLDSLSSNRIKNVDSFILLNEGKDERIHISETSYGLFTFSSLIFLIIGFFLAEITKLKVGSIELEKTVLDTASTSSSLNIKGK